MNFKFQVLPSEKYFFIMLSAFFISSCKKEHQFDCFKSSGKTITEERPVSYFNRVDAYNDVNLVFHNGPTGIVKVTGAANIMNGIVTSVENNTITIRNENKCNWVRDFKNKFTVDIWLDSLNSLTNYGSGNITFNDTLFTNQLEYNNWTASGSVKIKIVVDGLHVNVHTGSADMEVSGTAGINYLFYNGYGLMNFKNLKTHITYITNQNSGDCSVNARDELGVSIKYIGNIYYTGNPPKLTTEITGTGQLIHE